MEQKHASEQRYALLIDADNVSSKYLKPIMDELSKYGTVTIKRIYGDWTLTLHAKWKDALLENSITPIQQFGYTQGKNATDSAMIIDAMDILYTGSVDGFCIVSSDSDFTRLASRLRESGRTVIGMGEKKTPTPFRKACDIFTTLELLVGERDGKSRSKSEVANTSTSSSQTMSKAEIERAVVDIITENLNNGKSTGLGEVGSRLLKRYPDFDVRSYGTKLLSKLLDEFTRVKITKDRSSVTVELADDKAPATAPAANDADASPAKPKRTRSRSRSRMRKTASASNETNLSAVVALATSENGQAAEQITVAEQSSVAEQMGNTTQTNSLVEVSSETEEQVSSTERASRTKQVSGAVEEAGKTGMIGKPRKTAAVAQPVNETPAAPADTAAVEAYIRQLIRDAGREGIALSTLSRRVRGKFRTFKVRDLGFTQLKNYVASLGDIEIEQTGSGLNARMGE
ncbi:NYN domain-containing protein [Adlercreutzia sp. ZJ141]|uniref:NYN domain-containing protein n=1 Tax=Adlercreutzia sp. ZJ141 TaxID=2709406 RepID=UPI0013EADF63|nr:NYN domain-containing protein [Adlercreutzia sp. ZJ141]